MRTGNFEAGYSLVCDVRGFVPISKSSTSLGMRLDRNTDGTASEEPYSGEFDNDDVVVVKESNDAPKEETALERAISRITSRSSYVDPGPPPDGGVEAWTQALVSRLKLAV